MRFPPSLSLLLVVLLGVLLVVLAVLQYRWTDQIRRAEQERIQAGLRAAASRFAEDFDRELARAFALFFLDPRRTPREERKDALVERYHTWKVEAPYPQLVERVLVAEVGEGEIELEELDEKTRRFVSVAWPDDMTSLRERLADASGRESGDDPARPPTPGLPLPIDSEIPALLIPLSRGTGRLGPRPAPAESLVILRLNLPFIQDRLLPELVEHHFVTGRELDYDVLVIDSDVSHAIVYRSSPRLSGRDMDRPDARAGLFTLRPFPFLRAPFLLSALEHRPPGRRPWHDREEMRHRLPRPNRSMARRNGAEAAWTLLVRHRAGSLEAAVSRTRARNLAVSLGILSLLAASMTLLLVSTRRARGLAQQQMEFVAGVSHEVRTPLSVIRSAGQNLADGTVDSPDQVRQYGALIEREGRRLSEMVEKVLELAEIQSSRRAPAARQALAVAEILAQALEDCEPLRQEKAVRIEKEIAAPLPRVKGDPAALRRALQNVLANAIKFSGAERPVEVRVEARHNNGPVVEVVVADHGPGIEKSDLPHVFEPFYRGKNALRQQVEGSGLGLSIVQRIVAEHDGRVAVESEPGRGTTVTVTLPAETTG